MGIKNSDAFLDELISEIQAMKADPEKDTVTRVLAMVLRVANKHNDCTALKRSFLMAAMSFDGFDQAECETLKNWKEKTEL